MLRERVFYTSAQKYIDDDERIKDMVHMWRRHRRALPYMAIAGLSVTLGGYLAGIQQWTSRIGLGLAAAAVSAAASTEYRVLVSTTKGLVLLRSSRVRQKAIGFVKRLPPDTVIRPVGSNLVITEWDVGGSVYSVMKRFQKSMAAISSG